MADQILNAVIQLEAQIAQQLQAEQVKADAWLETVRREQEAIITQSRQRFVEKYQHSLSEAEQQAEQQAATLLQAERNYCQRLEEFDERTLLEVLRRQLVKILPRFDDDHQDGES